MSGRYIRVECVMTRLQGKVAFITGAGGGIGGETARKFLSEGAKVAGLDLSAEKAVSGLGEEAVAEGRAIGLECDVSNPESVRTAIAEAVGTFGSLNVLINAAGGSSANDGPVTEAPDEEFWRVMKIDLYGTFQVCKFGIPELIKSGGGSVINFTSVVALLATERRDCYTAAKGGVAAVTRSMANWYAKDGIRVNAIAPGLTMTPRLQGMYDVTPEIQAFATRHLLGPCTPEDIAGMATFLASDEAARVTGQIMQVDSGVTIH